MHSRLPGWQQAQITMVGLGHEQRAHRGSCSVPHLGSGSRGIRSGASVSPITTLMLIDLLLPALRGLLRGLLGRSLRLLHDLHLGSGRHDRSQGRRRRGRGRRSRLSESGRRWNWSRRRGRRNGRGGRLGHRGDHVRATRLFRRRWGRARVLTRHIVLQDGQIHDKPVMPLKQGLPEEGSGAPTKPESEPGRSPRS